MRDNTHQLFLPLRIACKQQYAGYLLLIEPRYRHLIFNNTHLREPIFTLSCKFHLQADPQLLFIKLRQATNLTATIKSTLGAYTTAVRIYNQYVNFLQFSASTSLSCMHSILVKETYINSHDLLSTGTKYSPITFRARSGSRRRKDPVRRMSCDAGRGFFSAGKLSDHFFRYHYNQDYIPCHYQCNA